MQPPTLPSSSASCARAGSLASWLTGICHGRNTPAFAEVATTASYQVSFEGFGAAGACAADLTAITTKELPSLVALYKELHAEPELSMHEERTAARLLLTRATGAVLKRGLGLLGVSAPEAM